MEDNQGQSSLFGLSLLVISLFSDGMLAETQRRLNEIKIPYSTYHLMESTSKFCTIFCLFYGISSQEIFVFCNNLYQIPESRFLFDFWVIILLGTVGQMFIFHTIRLFGPIVCGVITTTRKFFAVICSIIVFQHAINLFQWISVAFVFAGVGVEMFYNVKIKGNEEAQKGKEFKV